MYEKVKQLHREGLTYREIAEKTKISIGTISNVLRGKTNPEYNHKDPTTWSVPELEQKIAFSDAATNAKGKSMEKVIESVSVATKSKTFKPISSKEFTRTVNNMERVVQVAETTDRLVKERLKELVPVKKPEILSEQRHEGTSAGVKILLGAGVIIGGVYAFDKIQPKLGTAKTLKLFLNVAQQALGVELDD